MPVLIAAATSDDAASGTASGLSTALGITDTRGNVQPKRSISCLEIRCRVDGGGRRQIAAFNRGYPTRSWPTGFFAGSVRVVSMPRGARI